MASIVTKNNIQLFISYAPGTGSTALEKHLIEKSDALKHAGFNIISFPTPNPGNIDDEFSRHASYVDYVAKTNNYCDYVATGIRNPFSFYFAEYKRILSKWILLLDQKNSWMYREGSENIRKLTLMAKNAKSFDDWFFNVMLESVRNGYMYINENHVDKATHFIRAENITESLDAITEEIFSVKFSEIIGVVPRVNESGYLGHYSQEMSERTKALALQLFGYYFHVHNYSFDDQIRLPVENHNNEKVVFISSNINNNLEVFQKDLVGLDIDISFLSAYEVVSFSFTLLNSDKNVILKTVKVANDINVGNFSLAFNFVAKLPAGEYTFNFFILDEIKKLGLFQKYITFKVLPNPETEDNQSELPFEITFLPSQIIS